VPDYIFDSSFAVRFGSWSIRRSVEARMRAAGRTDGLHDDPEFFEALVDRASASARRG
jgi:hypothetical protein